jgi:hypothetical protein
LHEWAVGLHGGASVTSAGERGAGGWSYRRRRQGGAKELLLLPKFDPVLLPALLPAATYTISCCR